ncbi:MAG: hypothetical protein RBJ76_06490 [Stenomitos frigidus ULC029]
MALDALRLCIAVMPPERSPLADLPMLIQRQTGWLAACRAQRK